MLGRRRDPLENAKWLLEVKAELHPYTKLRFSVWAKETIAGLRWLKQGLDFAVVTPAQLFAAILYDRGYEIEPEGPHILFDNLVGHIRAAGNAAVTDQFIEWIDRQPREDQADPPRR